MGPGKSAPSSQGVISKLMPLGHLQKVVPSLSQASSVRMTSLVAGPVDSMVYTSVAAAPLLCIPWSHVLLRAILCPRAEYSENPPVVVPAVTPRAGRAQQYAECAPVPVKADHCSF